MPSESSPLPLGTILDGKFRIAKEIGRGGMAAVFEAENVDIGKRVAVKVLAAELVQSRVVNERFLREARAAAAIRSPYICDVYDVGTFNDRPFLVMELLEGESLYDRLTRVRRLDVAQTLTIAKQAARGLSKAHMANIVHRDLKPENIFLTKTEEGEVVTKIVDFGLAKFYEPHAEGGAQARLTKEGALFGTPAYMSPEQAKAQGGVDHRSDLWALACIVYECLTGRTVWNVDQGVAMILAQIAGAPIPRPTRLVPELPPSFDDWFLRALDRNPDKRFQTAKEFADTLTLALDASRPQARRPQLSTDEEGEVVDQLFGGEPPGDVPARPLAKGSSGDVAVPLPSTMPPAAKGRGTGFAIGLLLLLTAIVLGGYGAWFYIMHPADQTALAEETSPVASAEGFEEASSRRPVETEPYALQVGAAQEQLARGKEAEALKLFRAAFESSKNNAARSFLAHAEVGQEKEGQGPCRVTGLGRPRPFQGSEEASSEPAVALTSAGLVVVWAETIPETRKRHAFATLLDQSLRRVVAPIAVTPEADLVQVPRLINTARGLLLYYWDNGLKDHGVYFRELEPNGRIAAAPMKISPSDQKQSYPATARTGEDDLWTVWTERTDTRVYDLIARQTDDSLKPRSDRAPLTSYSPPARGTSTASRASVFAAHGNLNVAYALERNNEHHVFLLRVGLSDQKLLSGGLPPPEKPGAPEQQDRFLGQLIPISTGAGKHNHPDIGCIDSGCFVVWDNESGGAHAAFVAAENGEVVWRREFAPKGLRPSLRVNEAGEIAVAFYADNRLRMARMTRDGLEATSVLARASGYQPAPTIVPGQKPAEWYIAWRDFEAARHEAFLLRAECK